MDFVKMHGLGNDFVLIDGRRSLPGDLARLARAVCDRRTGVGGDGLLILLNSDNAAARMRIINADGSHANMCGNGLRCFAKYIYELGLVSERAFNVETDAGVMSPEIYLDNGRIVSVRVMMDRPEFERGLIPMIGSGKCVEEEISVLGKTFFLTAMLMGVPQAVVFVDELDELDIATYGPAIENHPLFPERVNVDFVRVLDEGNIVMRAWERGCGQTPASGTGSCASVVASALTGRTRRGASVRYPLGRLNVLWADDGRVYMDGPAETAFTGQWPG